MSTTVFILGAGASRDSGAPLMGEFLDTARHLRRTGEARGYEKQFDAVFDAIASLTQVHSKSSLDIANIETVFTSFEMAGTMGTFPDLSSEDIAELRKAARILIAITIERSQKFPYKDQHVAPPSPYSDFARLVRALAEDANPKQTVALITFNYDIAVDYAMHFRRMPVIYAIGSLQPEDGGVPLLKLHGSLNWGLCEHCNKVETWPIPHFLQRYRPGASLATDDEPREIVFPVATNIAELLHSCGKRVGPCPVIVPPTWNKGDYHAELSSVWSRAGVELRDAENIFVIGYSLPPTDEFFRHLYALGTASRSQLERFWVFNPDGSDSTRQRFSALLGPGAIGRFEYHPVPFREAVPHIGRTFFGEAWGANEPSN